jgi:hypothetical protein
MGVYSRVNRPIIVQPYDPAWPDLYAAEQERILDCLGGRPRWSTSAARRPGLDAKRVIDIVVGVRSLDDAPKCIAKLERWANLRAQLRGGDRAALSVGRDAGGIRITCTLPCWGEVWGKPICFRLPRSHPEEYSAIAH